MSIFVSNDFRILVETSGSYYRPMKRLLSDSTYLGKEKKKPIRVRLRLSALPPETGDSWPAPNRDASLGSVYRYRFDRCPIPFAYFFVVEMSWRLRLPSPLQLGCLTALEKGGAEEECVACIPDQAARPLAFSRGRMVPLGTCYQARVVRENNDLLPGVTVWVASTGQRIYKDLCETTKTCRSTPKYRQHSQQTLEAHRASWATFRLFLSTVNSFYRQPRSDLELLPTPGLQI